MSRKHSKNTIQRHTKAPKAKAHTVRLKDGFELSIEKDALDDWELMEALMEMDSEHPEAAMKALPMLIGTEQMQKLKEHLRTPSGRVPMSKMVQVFGEVFSTLNEAKK